MKHFWLSWYQCTPDHRPLTYPPNNAILGWWKSGETMVGDSIICAHVQAESLRAAWAAVDVDWPRPERVERFAEQVPGDFAPSDRFVRTDWMTARGAGQGG